MALVFNTPKTAINTTTRDMQNLSSDCPPCPEVNLTTADVEYTENGEYTVTPEEGYDGLTQVDITVNIPSDVRNQDKLVTPTTSYQTITADSGYSGIGTVDVLPVTSSIDANITAGNIKKDVSILGVTGSYDPQPILQSKTIDPATSIQGVQADAGYDGLSDVTINAVTAAIDQNIQPENILSGVTILDVTGTDAGYSAGYDDGYAQGQAECPTPTYIPLGETITQNGTYLYDPTDYDGGSFDYFSDAAITVNVPSSANLETKSVTYTANDTYTITPTAGKDGMSSVEVTVNVPSGGSNCPDWSTIGWNCSDVTTSGLAADVAYAAQAKADFEGGIKSVFFNDKNLKIVPKIDYTGQAVSASFFSNTNIKYSTTIDFDGATALSLQNMFSKTPIDSIVLLNTTSNTNCEGTFSDCSFLTSVNLFDTSNVTSMYRMFANCTSLTTIPQFDTSNVLAMGYMFSNCASLTTIPQLNTSKVRDLSQLFYACTELVSVPLLDAAKVEQLNNTFYRCNKLTNLGGFTNLGKAFVGTSTLYHTLYLNNTTLLTKQSIMNVINNLAAPDDTTCTDATLYLSAASYALLDASDIAIATAKNWTVTS